MILPIVAYGDPVLRKKAKNILPEHPHFKDILENMWETMYNAKGLGLAAPQVGLPIRLFLVDTFPFSDDPDFTKEEATELSQFKKAFINAEIIEENGEEWAFNEGCLSIPNVTEDVFRKEEVVIRYLDENFIEHTQTYHGMIARVIQHEYDHIEGILFTDKISSLKKRLIKGKLSNISKGKTSVEYRMRFPEVKGRKQ
jgi:peptide deformylase